MLIIKVIYLKIEKNFKSLFIKVFAGKKKRHFKRNQLPVTQPVFARLNAKRVLNAFKRYGFKR